METTGRTNIRGVIDDILAGVGDVVIMEKYNLSPQEFMEALEKVKNAKGMDAADIKHRMDALMSNVNRKDQERRLPRNYLMFETKVYDNNDPSVSGVINDLTERGLQISGIHSKPGELRDFFIVGSEVIFVEKPLQFMAQCRWVKVDKETGESLAGFEIKKMTPSTLRGIKKLVKKLGVSEKF